MQILIFASTAIGLKFSGKVWFGVSFIGKLVVEFGISNVPEFSRKLEPFRRRAVKNVVGEMRFSRVRGRLAFPLTLAWKTASNRDNLIPDLS